ncbi:MAG: rhomboid family intramembrane serine protease [Nannocystaceae bacterium]
MGALRLSSLWLDGSWWRVISAGFLHGSVLHLVLNTWSLWVVGELAEATWGHARTGVLFALSSVGGCLASAAWVEAPMVVGASAGIMGIAGAILVGRLIGRGRVASALEPLSARILGGWLVALVALGFFVDMIAQAGHLGGLLIGLLIGLAWSGQGAGVSLAGRVGVGMAITGMLLAARQPEGREGYYEFIGQGYLDRGQDLEAAAAYERALARRPDDARLANDLAYGWAKAGARLEDAERLVRGALVAEPDNAAYLDTLGWVLCRQGRVEAGMAVLRRAVQASEEEDEEIEGHLTECADAQVVGEGD